MKHLTLFLFGFCLALSFTSFAQHKITGRLVDDNSSPISFANVLLLNPSDSSLIRGAITNEDGDYEFENIPTNDYLLSASMLGYETVFTTVFNPGNTLEFALDPLILTTGVDLAEVNVVAKKPLYEQKIDRLVINVENSITSAGATALDILERSPGVVVNRQNGLISLVGKEGVVVMINGKINYMPVSGLLQMLAGMSADNIERIELITTPPAKYDAEGNAGFVNIVLKKRTDLGTNGSYSLSGGYGRGGTSNANLNFNHRKGKINLFGSYSFLRNAQAQEMSTTRFIFEDNSTTQTKVFTAREPVQRNHNLRFGLDYQIGDKTIIGGVISAYDNKWTMEAENESVEKVNDANTSIVRLFNTERNQWHHVSGNLNLKHDFTPKSSISFDVDYLYYKDENPNNYINSFFEGDNTFLREELARSDKITPINIYVGKMDYSNQISDGLRLEAGIKGVFSVFENDVLVETNNGQSWVKDPELSNNSDLDEEILAAYTSADYTISEKTNVKVGLRYEYTDSKLDTDTEGRVVDRQFGKLFPSVFVSHNFNDNNGINASFSRRITRPTFNDMAPFVILLDPNTFFAGNAGLQPAISNAVKLDYRYKTAVLSFQYSVEDSTIAGFQERVVTENNKLFYEPINLKNSKTFSVSLGFPITVTQWWTMRNNFLFIDQNLNSFYLGEPVSFNQSYFQANTTQSFTLPKDFSAEMSFLYFGPQFYGSAKVDAYYLLNVGIQKNFGPKWGTLRFNINDALNSTVFKWVTRVPGQNFETDSSLDFFQRTFVLTYSRTFGNNKLKSARRRALGSEEERRRVN